MFHSLSQEWALKGIGCPRNQDQDVEQGKGDGDPACADAGQRHGIGQRADQVDHERKKANQGKLGIHVIFGLCCIG